MTIRVNATRGLPQSRGNLSVKQEDAAEQKETRNRSRLNSVSADWHRRAQEMYNLREQERREFARQNRRKK